MCRSNIARLVLVWVLGLVLAVTLGAAEPAAQPGTASPIERLTSTLRLPIHDETSLRIRGESLRQQIQALRAADLGPALRLTGWTDEDPDPGIREVDQKAIGLLKQRFVEHCRQLLKNGDETDRLAVITQIDTMYVGGWDSASRDLPVVLASDLVRAVKDQDAAVRSAAARALSKFRPPTREVLDALAGALRTDDVELRRSAAEAVAALLQGLKGTIKGRGFELSRGADAAATARSVIPLAGRCIADRDMRVRQMGLVAFRTVAGFLGEPLIEISGEVRAVLIEVRATKVRALLSPAEAEVLLKTCREEQSLLQPVAQELGAQLPSLTGSLADHEHAVRISACEALESISTAWRKHVQRGADIALLQEGAKVADDPLGPALRRAVPGLAALVADADVRLRLAALYALEELEADAAPAVEALVKALKDQDPFVRWAAVRALGKMAPHEADKAVPGLAGVLDDDNGDVRATAADALRHYGPAAGKAVPSLARVVSGREEAMRVLAIRALAAVGAGAEPAVPALSGALKAPEVEVRAEAARCLARLGPAARQARQALREALNDPDQEVRRAASDALLTLK